MAELVYSAGELARALGVSEYTVYRHAKAGEIPSITIGSRRVFPRAAIDRWLVTGVVTDRSGSTSTSDHV